ncbi:hypothetical protein [Halobacillus hunanensis]|nr:hypothetical protein [Halobacillus hunanensis]
MKINFAAEKEGSEKELGTNHYELGKNSTEIRPNPTQQEAIPLRVYNRDD